MMMWTLRSKALSDFSTLSTWVALESLIHSTPSSTRTGSRRWGSPGYVSSPFCSASRPTPRCRASRHAANAFSRLCEPRRVGAVSEREAPAIRRGWRGSKPCRWTPGWVAMAFTRVSDSLMAALSPGRWFWKMRCFAAAYGDDGLELVARQLADGRIQPVAREHPVAERVAQVSAGEDPQAGGGEQVPAQGGGGALAVGPGDPEERLFDEPGRQLDLADHLQRARARLGEERERERNARAHHYQVDAAERIRHHPPQLALEGHVAVVRRDRLGAT